MTHSLYECKIRFPKVQENGKIKRVTESYLVDALSFTEAEARIVEEETPFVEEGLNVVGIKKVKCTELFDQFGGDKYYDCKVVFVTIDEKTAREKKTSEHIMVTYRDWETDRKSTRLNSSHSAKSRMPSSA